MLEVYYVPHDKKASYKREITLPNSHLDLFSNISEVLRQIPLEERINLHYTTGHVWSEDESKKVIDFPKNRWGKQKVRQIKYQDVYPFDVDGQVDKDQWERYVDIIASFLRIQSNALTVVWSGNGLQLLAHVKTPFTLDQLNKRRPKYKKICEGLNAALMAHNLPGKFDTGVFRNAATLRLPGTINRKDAGDKECVLLQVGKVVDYTIEEILDTEGVGTEYGKSTPLDKSAVLTDCLFLGEMKKNQDKQTYTQWFNMMTVLSAINTDLCHEYSKEYGGYSYEETESLAHTCRGSYGPRYCSVIQRDFGRCGECKHFQKISSPIEIKGEDFIKTEKSGFREPTIGKDGTIKRGKVAYADLYKKFCQTHGALYRHKLYGNFLFEDGFFKEILTKEVMPCYALEYVTNPEPSSHEQLEFAKRFARLNQIEENETVGRMNLKSGVFNFKNYQVEPHSVKYFFKGRADFDFDPDANCPEFDKWFEYVMPDEDVRKSIFEFLGVAFAGVPAVDVNKALIFVGDGANGKSVLLDTIGEMIGDNLIASVGMDELTENAGLLKGKLINLSSESDSSFGKEGNKKIQEFKKILSGEKITVNIKYTPKFEDHVNAKHIFSMNRYPRLIEVTHAWLRRLLIIPWERTITKEEMVYGYHRKFRSEHAGIFNKILEGYERWKINGRFTESEKHSEGMANMKEQDSVYDFVQDYIDVTNDKADFVSTSRLFESFRRVEPNDRYTKQRVLIAKIKAFIVSGDYGGTLDYSEDSNVRRKVDGSRSNIRGLAGIRLREEF